MTNTKSLLLAVVTLFSLLINSCQKDVDEASCGSNQPSSKLWGNSVSISINGRVFDQNGDPVSGAQVSAGNSNTTTDPMGVFHLTNVSAYQRLAYVKVEKMGYFPGSRSFVPGGSSEVVEIELLPKSYAGTVLASSGGAVNAQGVSITLSANSMVKSDNTPHTGNVNISLAYIDPTGADFTREMPGNLLGVQNNQSQGLTSYGMVAVELRSGAGEPLQLAQGQTAEVRFPIPAVQQSSAPATIDLWSFDEVNGYWKHEGQASKNGPEYVAQVSHFSFWNCDIPWDFIVLDGLVKDANNQPVQGATVTISGSNFGSASDITNGQGVFAGYVPVNTQLTINVSIICGVSSVQVYSAIIGPFTSNTTLTTIAISPQNITTVTGTVVDCNNTPLANSYVVAFGQVVFAPVGQFSFQACGSSVNIIPYGTIPWVLGTAQTVQLNGSIVNAGNLLACSGSGSGTVTDIDGNTYATVIVGNQEWMAENLKVSNYRNGNPIPTNLSNSSWYSTFGACAIYDNNPVNDSIYGKLYNWYAVADVRGLCPTGWHVPSDAEWNELVITLDPMADTTNQMFQSSIAGGLMKATGTLHAGNGLWQSPNTGANNNSGFTALPSGSRLNDGSFNRIGRMGYWWSSTSYTSLSHEAWYRILDSNNTQIARSFNYKTRGYSVRCVKD